MVANEVKELAKETGRATADIRKRIEAIQTDTQTAVASIEGISRIIHDIDGMQATIAAAVQEQLATSQEITSNLNEVAQGSQEIAAYVVKLAEASNSASQGAEATLATATEVSAGADRMQGLMAKFQV